MDTNKKNLMITLKNPGQSTVTSIVKLELELNKVPQIVPIDILKKTGHAPDYIIRKCNQYNITLKQLITLVELNEEYDTHLPLIFRMMERGYEIQEIEVMLQVRQIVKSQLDQQVSIVQLVRMHEQLNIPFISEYIYQIIVEIHKTLENYRREITPYADENHAGVSIDLVLQRTKVMQSPFWEDGIASLINQSDLIEDNFDENSFP
jgi:hypothetical protein